MAKKAYIATVQLLLVDVENEYEASDAIAGMMTDNHVDFRDGGVLKDWAYLKVGAQWMHVVETTISDDYEEGDFVR